MSIKGATEQKAATLDEFPLPPLDDLPPTLEIGSQQPPVAASALASADAAGEEYDEDSHHSVSASHSPEESEGEEEDAEIDVEAEDEEPEVEASQKSEEEVSNDAEAVAPVKIEAAAEAATKPTVEIPANTSVVSIPVAASIPQESVGKVAKIAKQVEASIAKQAEDAQKVTDAQNAKAAEIAAEHAKIEADKKPEASIASDKKLQDAKDAHKDQAASEEKARLAALKEVPGIAANLAEKAKEVAVVKLPHIQAEAEKTLAAESEANRAAEVAAVTHKKADEEKAAKVSVGKVGKAGKVDQVSIQVAQALHSTMQESVGKLPRNLAARFTETLANVEKASDAVKVKVGTEEHGNTKALVTQFESKSSQALDASKIALASTGPTNSIGKVAKAFK
jgi:hypothetical protein